VKEKTKTMIKKNVWVDGSLEIHGYPYPMSETKISGWTDNS